MPTISLLDNRNVNDMMNGLGYFIGSLPKLENRYLDLNAKLFNYRRVNKLYDLLSKDDFAILTTPARAREYTSSPVILDYLEVLSKYVLDEVPDFDTYDIIGYSIEQKTGGYHLLIPSVIFLIIFNNFLQSKLNKKIPSYVGGNGNPLFEKFMTENQNFLDDLGFPLPTNFFNVHDGQQTFLEYLIRNLKHDVKNIDKTVPSFKCINHKKSTAFEFPENLEDYLPDFDRVFSKEITSKFPELKDIKPFNVGAFKFSEGCDFGCSFCVEYDNPSQFHYGSVDVIIESLKKFQDNGITKINFFNNNINTSLKWADEFCNKIIQNNISIKWTDSANLFVVDNDLFPMLKAAGCARLWFGADAVSNNTLREVKKSLTTDKIIKGLELSHKAGIWNQANFICNYPNETVDDHLQLVNFLKKYMGTILNGFAVNYFELRRDSKYYLQPELFNVTMLDGSTASPKYNFETTTNSWQEILDRGIEKWHECYNAVGIEDPYLFEVADHLFYTLHDVYNGNKLKIKEIFQYILDNNLVDGVTNISNNKLKDHYLEIYNANFTNP